MNTNVLTAIIGQLGVHPRAFLAGWWEGRHRYQVSDGQVIPASIFERGSIGYAASQASVAFHGGLDAD